MDNLLGARTKKCWLDLSIQNFNINETQAFASWQNCANLDIRITVLNASDRKWMFN